MKKITLFIFMAIVAVSLIACGAAADKPVANNTNAANTNTNLAANPAAPTSSPASSVTSPGQTTQVKVYLVAAGDNGKKGKAFGNFGESLVAVALTSHTELQFRSYFTVTRSL